VVRRRRQAVSKARPPMRTSSGVSKAREKASCAQRRRTEARPPASPAGAPCGRGCF
jgi:hypothetical protein